MKIADTKRLVYVVVLAIAAAAAPGRAVVGQVMYQAIASVPGATYPTDLVRYPPPGSPGPWALFTTVSTYNIGNDTDYVVKLSPPAPGVVHGSWTKSVLYQEPVGSSTQLEGPVLVDRSGTIFGEEISSLYFGQLFKLTPPTEGATTWKYTLLYKPVYPRICMPVGGLISDSSGAFYGTSLHGPADLGHGYIFELTPSKVSAGTYDFKILYEFPNYAAPAYHMSMDHAGNLYGTTSGSGTIFKLSRPAGAATTWTLQTLYRFPNDGTDTGPYAVAMDDRDNLYSWKTTAAAYPNVGKSFVFKLSPPTTVGGTWTTTTIAQIPPPLVTDLKFVGGVLIGTTGNSIFELSPPQDDTSPWMFQTLHTFTIQNLYPWDAPSTLDSKGNLYGATRCSTCTLAGGSIYKLYTSAVSTPP